MQFDQQYLDHLKDVVRQVAQAVDEVLPIVDFSTHPEVTEPEIDDRVNQRKIAFDNILADMLGQSYVIVSDPKRGMAEDVTLEDEGPRG